MTPSNRSRPVYRQRRASKRAPYGPMVLVLVFAVAIGLSVLYFSRTADAATQTSPPASTAAVAQAETTQGEDSQNAVAETTQAEDSQNAVAETTQGEDSQNAVAETAKAEPKQEQISHVTFGAHTQATQECVTCHPDQPTGEIACRTCHGYDCGKNAKSAADCLKCHETGTTQSWIPSE